MNKKNNSSTSQNNSKANSQEFINKFDNVFTGKSPLAKEFYQALNDGTDIPAIEGTKLLVQTQKPGYERIYLQTGDTERDRCFYFKDYTEVDFNTDARTLDLESLAEDIIYHNSKILVICNNRYSNKETYDEFFYIFNSKEEAVRFLKKNNIDTELRGDDNYIYCPETGVAVRAVRLYFNNSLKIWGRE